MKTADYVKKLREFNKKDYWLPDLVQVIGAVESYVGSFPNEKVIDYGCGLGATETMLGPEHWGRVIGFEPNAEIRKKSRYKLTLDLKQLLDAAETWSFFRTVVLNHSLAHIPLNELFKNLEAVMSDGYVVGVVTPNKKFYAEMIKRKILTKEETQTDPTVLHDFDQKSLEDLFRKRGFTTVRSELIGEAPEEGWPEDALPRVLAVFERTYTTDGDEK